MVSLARVGRRFWRCAIVMGFALGNAAQAGTPQVLLEADFDDKTIDAPIGIGGAAVGEPVSIDAPLVAAVVRGAPFPTPALEITDLSDFSAAVARFEFLNSAEIIDGTLTIEMNLWFSSFEDYFVRIRESQFSTSQFPSINFDSGGNIAAFAPTFIGLGTYQTGEALALKLVFRHAETRFDVWVNGTEVLTNHDYGPGNGEGIGSILLGVGSDVETDGSFLVDDLRVIGEGFTPIATTSWARLKGAFDQAAHRERP